MIIDNASQKDGRKKRNKLSDSQLMALKRYYKSCSKETRIANIQDAISHQEFKFRHRVQGSVIDKTVYEYIYSNLSVTSIAMTNNINIAMIYDNIIFILKIVNEFFSEVEKNV